MSRETPPRERVEEILGLILEGYSTTEIAELTGIKPRTVKYHVRALCRAHGVKHKRELIRAARAEG